jgi:hypothetical protein
MTISSAYTTQEDIYTENFCFGQWEAVLINRKRRKPVGVTDSNKDFGGIRNETE